MGIVARIRHRSSPEQPPHERRRSPARTGPAGPTLPGGLIWLVPYGARNAEYHWHGLQHLTGNLCPLLGVLLLAALAVHLLGARFPAPLRRAATSLLSREGEPRQP
ncbi:hypothetical protein [Streptacidiphilus melanogenes]|uniref:hypothetical protein n=1 Tax=Streptacidiphilus melanogenes TaxID=411235 RepID=UPI0005A7E30B|nr:hypothetical protein [Streptacidiphilus melanogenes]